MFRGRAPPRITPRNYDAPSSQAVFRSLELALPKRHGLAPPAPTEWALSELLGYYRITPRILLPISPIKARGC